MFVDMLSRFEVTRLSPCGSLSANLVPKPTNQRGTEPKHIAVSPATARLAAKIFLKNKFAASQKSSVMNVGLITCRRLYFVSIANRANKHCETANHQMASGRPEINSIAWL